MKLIEGLPLGESPLSPTARQLKQFRLISAVLATERLDLVWDDFFAGVAFLTPDFLDKTVGALVQYGISKEAISSFLLYAMMHRLLRVYPEALSKEEESSLCSSHFWRVVASAIQCDLIPTSNSEEVLRKLQLQTNREGKSLDFLLLWSRLDHHFPEDAETIFRLSVPFGCIEEDYPDILAWRADLYYNFGQHGDEEIACEMAVRAAFRGSGYAWELLSQWASKGDCIQEVLLRMGPILTKDTAIELPAVAQSKVSALVNDLG